MWENTEITNGKGRIEAKNQKIQSAVGNELPEMMKTSERASKKMSDTQQKKIAERLNQVGEDLKICRGLMQTKQIGNPIKRKGSEQRESNDEK